MTYAYKKIGSKYTRKYGKNVRQLAKCLSVSMPTLVKWEKSGFDIFYKAANLNSFKGNRTLQRIWANMKDRCGNPKNKDYRNYGGKGIKIQLEKKDLAFLWKRDKASLMKQPSIDRINSQKSYTIKNCRFIEMEKNRVERSWIRKLQLKTKED